MTPRKKLEILHQDFVGSEIDTMTDMEMVIEVLEMLINKAEEQDGHSHSIT